MKKIFVIVLAFALVMSFAALAFAATSEGKATGTETGPTVPVTEDTGPNKGNSLKVPSPSKPDIVVLHGKGEGGSAGRLIVKFDTGEIRVATPIYAPYGDEGKAAIELADKVVKGVDDVEDEAVKEAIKAFFAENPGSLAEGVIALGEDAVENGSVTLAVSARGFDKVQFTAPGDADNLGFVVLNEK